MSFFDEGNLINAGDITNMITTLNTYRAKWGLAKVSVSLSEGQLITADFFSTLWEGVKGLYDHVGWTLSSSPTYPKQEELIKGTGDVNPIKLIDKYLTEFGDKLDKYIYLKKVWLKNVSVADETTYRTGGDGSEGIIYNNQNAGLGVNFTFPGNTAHNKMPFVFYISGLEQNKNVIFRISLDTYMYSTSSSGAENNYFKYWYGTSQTLEAWGAIVTGNEIHKSDGYYYLKNTDFTQEFGVKEGRSKTFNILTGSDGGCGFYAYNNPASRIEMDLKFDEIYYSS